MIRYSIKLFLLVFIAFVTACSNDSPSTSDDANIEMSDDTSYEMAMDEATEEKAIGFDGDAEESQEQEIAQEDEQVKKNQFPDVQMIIYTGHIQVEVDDLTTMNETIRTKVSKLGGYVASSEEYVSGEGERRHGRIQLRIPQEHYEQMMRFTEENSAKVMEKVSNGQDVSEEYVDLESRLRSKEAVEERLFTFMDQAKKTDDLLKISKDLSAVQEDIERIKGRMDYLDNQVAFSTITINIQENQVKVSELQGRDDLNTGEKAQSLFMNTLNFLITVGSGFVVFLVGLSPILIPLLMAGGFIWWKVRTKKRSHSNE
uniref:DUF4349 domain-containing protein n=1 Tax=uncultured Allobacillus sp. TaxID=1638025 RepID=UPI002596B541|nr:DUF4349 domain-containing protein [uncultured Allobacillus sp.]